MRKNAEGYRALFDSFTMCIAGYIRAEKILDQLEKL